MQLHKFKGHVFFIFPTIGFWKNDFTGVMEDGGIQYGLQFNWFKWQIGIIWKKN